MTYHPLELKHPAAGKQMQRAPQATLPLDEHKAVRWAGGRGHPNQTQPTTAKREHGEARCLVGVKDDNGKFLLRKAMRGEDDYVTIYL